MVKRTQRAQGVMGDETLSGLSRTHLKRLLSGALETRPAGAANYCFSWRREMSLSLIDGETVCSPMLYQCGYISRSPSGKAAPSPPCQPHRVSPSSSLVQPRGRPPGRGLEAPARERFKGDMRVQGDLRGEIAIPPGLPAKSILLHKSIQLSQTIPQNRKAAITENIILPLTSNDSAETKVCANSQSPPHSTIRYTSICPGAR